VIAIAEGGGISAFFGHVRELRRRKADLAVLLPNSFRTALIAKLGGARTIAGYSGDGRRLLLDIIVPRSPEPIHQVASYLRIASSVERELTGASQVDFEATRPKLCVRERDRDRGWDILSAGGIRPDQPLALLNPGATNSRAKRWLPERFAETADRLIDRDGFRVAIIGAPGDEAAARETALSMKREAATLAGKTSIADLKAVLSCASLLISNDTGAAHVAAALDVPTVVVFGPTEHLSTRPLSEVAQIVRHDVSCSPCMLRDCPIDHRCMTGVRVDEVYAAARRLLSRVGAG
jgi:heptosyltransferase-2